MVSIHCLASGSGQGKLTYVPTTRTMSDRRARRLSYCPSFFLAAAAVVQNPSVDVNMKYKRDSAGYP